MTGEGKLELSLTAPGGGVDPVEGALRGFLPHVRPCDDGRTPPARTSGPLSSHIPAPWTGARPYTRRAQYLGAQYLGARPVVSATETTPATQLLDVLASFDLAGAGPERHTPGGQARRQHW